MAHPRAGEDLGARPIDENILIECCSAQGAPQPGIHQHEVTHLEPPTVHNQSRIRSACDDANCGSPLHHTLGTLLSVTLISRDLPTFRLTFLDGRFCDPSELTVAKQPAWDVNS